MTKSDQKLTQILLNFWYTKYLKKIKIVTTSLRKLLNSDCCKNDVCCPLFKNFLELGSFLVQSVFSYQRMILIFINFDVRSSSDFAKVETHVFMNRRILISLENLSMYHNIFINMPTN